jgi:squalene-hopene/tetraprenyl-beta-curcumene cyclase
MRIGTPPPHYRWDMMPHLPILGSFAVAAAVVSTSFLSIASVAQDSSGKERSKRPQSATPIGDESRRAVLAEPDRQLDERVPAEKITEFPSPEVPRFVAPPLPPIFEIAVDDAEVAMSPESAAAARASLDAGLDWLVANQGSDGSWMRGSAVTPTDMSPRRGAASVAVTALAVKALVQAPETPARREALDKALRFITGELDAGGGFDGIAKGGIGNYVTSSVVMGLASTRDLAFSDRVADGVAWLRRNQWDQSEGVKPSQDWYGGAGYGRSGRPDLSNTQLMLDALQEAGVSPDDPAIQRALVFVGRTQNLPESNPAPWAQDGSGDGGFVYTPANGGESFASENAGEGRYGEIRPEGAPRSLRSYGSMTYAGFKSLLYAGLASDDPRVRAAFDWIRRHWTFEENPGLGAQGHYYYLHAMSRALLAAQQPTVATIDGVERNWREELAAALVGRQRSDGSWINSADRWEESNPELVTVYATLALEEALKPAMRVAD